jgi:hypothetical protein
LLFVPINAFRLLDASITDSPNPSVNFFPLWSSPLAQNQNQVSQLIQGRFASEFQKLVGRETLIMEVQELENICIIRTN